MISTSWMTISIMTSGQSSNYNKAKEASASVPLTWPCCFIISKHCFAFSGLRYPCRLALTPFKIQEFNLSSASGAQCLLFVFLSTFKIPIAVIYLSCQVLLFQRFYSNWSHKKWFMQTWKFSAFAAYFIFFFFFFSVFSWFHCFVALLSLSIFFFLNWVQFEVIHPNFILFSAF